MAYSPDQAGFLSRGGVPSSPFAGDRNQVGAENEAKWNAAQAFLAATERANRSAGVQQQDANIASHGTIEDAPTFARRQGMQSAADTLDPSNPLGALRGHEDATKLAQIHESNVRPAEINAGSDLDVAGIHSGDLRYGAQVNSQDARYKADTEATGGLEKEVANQMIGRDFKETDPSNNRGTAIEGFLTALDALRKRQAAVR